MGPIARGTSSSASIAQALQVATGQLVLSRPLKLALLHSLLRQPQQLQQQRLRLLQACRHLAVLVLVLVLVSSVLGQHLSGLSSSSSSLSGLA
jgi:phosphopantetheinyl transferase